MRKEKELSEWWNYFMGGNKTLLKWIGFLVAGVLFECAISKVYSKIVMPEATLRDVIEKTYKWINEAFNTQFFTEGHINPIIALAALGSIFTFFRKISKHWIYRIKDRYDLLFLTKPERERERFFRLMFFTLLLFGLFFLLFTTNLFNILDNLGLKMSLKVVFIAGSHIVFLIAILVNILNLDKNGGTNIAAYMTSSYIIVIWALYPVKEANLCWILIHSAFAAISSVKLMDIMVGDFGVYTSIYSFESHPGNRLFIHYRLDEERLVCSREIKMGNGTERIIIEISDLCKQKMEKDTTVYDKDWLETIEKVRTIRSEENWETLGEKIKQITSNWVNFFSGMLCRCKHFVENVFSHTKAGLTIIGRKISIIRRQRVKICELKDEIKKLKQEKRESERK